MTVYCGVDLHARQQTVGYVNTSDGEVKRRELHHRRDDVRAFYAQFKSQVIVGVEACGYTAWFEQMIEDLDHTIMVGDAVEIRRLARRRQKTDRRDADLILDLHFPKKHDFATITDRHITHVMQRLNNRPGKTLGHKTPNEVFFKLPLVALTT